VPRLVGAGLVEGVEPWDCIAQVYVTETPGGVHDRDSERESNHGIEGGRGAAWGNVRSRTIEGSYVMVFRSNGY
jgi:hypothetical protein